MPEFPNSESDIKALAALMYNGFLQHPDDFPSVDRLGLYLKRLFYKLARNTQTEAISQARSATEAKRESLNSLKRVMKNCLKKSEVDVNSNPQKLSYIGWGIKSAPQTITAPGQPENLHPAAEGTGTLLLMWDKPSAGGAVRNYIIERRQFEKIAGIFSQWETIETSLDCSKALSNQLKGCLLEYRVTAVNSAGKSLSSNTTAITL